MESRIYQASKRLGAVTHDQLSRAFGRFQLGEPISVAPVPFGLFGQNIFVTTESGKFVFRGAPHSAWQFPTERFFTQMLRESTTAPAAWPYVIDDSCEFFPWSYAIMPRMPGILAVDPQVKARLSDGDRVEMARAMARNLATMQELTSPACGRFDPVRNAVRPVPLTDEVEWPWVQTYGDVGTPPSFREIVIARIRRLIERARVSNTRATTDSDIEWIEEIISEGVAALDEPLEPRFVMEDYQEGNVLFAPRGAGWEVSGVFDLMGCYFGDGEIDLSRTAATYLDESPGLAREFAATWLRLVPMRRGFGARFRVYMLLDRSIIWEYVQRRDAGAVRLGGFRQWAERYTSIAETFAFTRR